jgi:hypothetical protein
MRDSTRIRAQSGFLQRIPGSVSFPFHSLHRKLGDDAKNRQFILTEWQVGYRIAEAVAAWLIDPVLGEFPVYAGRPA